MRSLPRRSLYSKSIPTGESSETGVNSCDGDLGEQSSDGAARQLSVAVLSLTRRLLSAATLTVERLFLLETVISAPASVLVGLPGVGLLSLLAAPDVAGVASLSAVAAARRENFLAGKLLAGFQVSVTVVPQLRLWLRPRLARGLWRRVRRKRAHVVQGQW